MRPWVKRISNSVSPSSSEVFLENPGQAVFTVMNNIADQYACTVRKDLTDKRDLELMGRSNRN